MYNTTKEELEQAKLARLNPDNKVVVADVINRMLDKYLVKAIKRDNLIVYLVTNNDYADVGNFETMLITKEEGEAMASYRGKLVDLVVEPFVDYVDDIASSTFSGVTGINIIAK